MRQSPSFSYRGISKEKSKKKSPQKESTSSNLSPWFESITRDDYASASANANLTSDSHSFFNDRNERYDELASGYMSHHFIGQLLHKSFVAYSNAHKMTSKSNKEKEKEKEKEQEAFSNTSETNAIHGQQPQHYSLQMKNRIMQKVYEHEQQRHSPHNKDQPYQSTQTQQTYSLSVTQSPQKNLLERQHSRGRLNRGSSKINKTHNRTQLTQPQPPYTNHIQSSLLEPSEQSLGRLSRASSKGKNSNRSWKRFSLKGNVEDDTEETRSGTSHPPSPMLKKFVTSFKRSTSVPSHTRGTRKKYSDTVSKCEDHESDELFALQQQRLTPRSQPQPNSSTSRKSNTDSRDLHTYQHQQPHPPAANNESLGKAPRRALLQILKPKFQMHQHTNSIDPKENEVIGVQEDFISDMLLLAKRTHNTSDILEMAPTIGQRKHFHHQKHIQQRLKLSNKPHFRLKSHYSPEFLRALEIISESILCKECRYLASFSSSFSLPSNSKLQKRKACTNPDCLESMMMFERIATLSEEELRNEIRCFTLRYKNLSPFLRKQQNKSFLNGQSTDSSTIFTGLGNNITLFEELVSAVRQLSWIANDSAPNLDPTDDDAKKSLQALRQTISSMTRTETFKLDPRGKDPSSLLAPKGILPSNQRKDNLESKKLQNQQLGSHAMTYPDFLRIGEEVLSPADYQPQSDWTKLTYQFFSSETIENDTESDKQDEFTKQFYDVNYVPVSNVENNIKQLIQDRRPQLTTKAPNDSESESINCSRVTLASETMIPGNKACVSDHDLNLSSEKNAEDDASAVEKSHFSTLEEYHENSHHNEYKWKGAEYRFNSLRDSQNRSTVILSQRYKPTFQNKNKNKTTLQSHEYNTHNSQTKDNKVMQSEVSTADWDSFRIHFYTNERKSSSFRYEKSATQQECFHRSSHEHLTYSNHAKDLGVTKTDRDDFEASFYESNHVTEDAPDTLQREFFQKANRNKIF